MLNNCSFAGRLTKDPVLYKTQNDTPVISFTVAVSRDYKNSQGEYDTDFIQCVAWKQTAEFVDQYCSKGMLIGVTGRMETRDYESDGRKVYVTELIADHVYFFEKKEKPEEKQNQYNHYSNNRK